jgi:hypothetical protein
VPEDRMEEITQDAEWKHKKPEKGE